MRPYGAIMIFDWAVVPLQLLLVGIAFVLCCLIGLERQFQHKAAGIRTHALVGVGSCVFTLISVEGFIYLAEYHVTRDPSRIAAQASGLRSSARATAKTVQGRPRFVKMRCRRQKPARLP